MTTHTDKFLVVIAGATAVGKSAVALSLARHFNTAIISADSRQIYKEMNIGTAKPTPAELASVPHYFINHIGIQTAYSAGDFEREAIAVIEGILKEKPLAIMVGGTGFYIKAVVEGLDEFPEVPAEVKAAVEADLQSHGIQSLQSELQREDPTYFKKIDIANPARLIRAVSLIRATGQPFSTFHKGGRANRKFKAIPIFLNRPRPELYRRINERVDKMMEAGLLREAEQLLPFKNLKALKTVGYAELFKYLDGDISLQKAVEAIKQNSRRYAKRQLTWFRKYGAWTTFHPDDFSGILKYIENQTQPEHL